MKIRSVGVAGTAQRLGRGSIEDVPPEKSLDGSATKSSRPLQSITSCLVGFCFSRRTSPYLSSWIRIFVDDGDSATFFRSANSGGDTGWASSRDKNVKLVGHCVRTCIFGWHTI